MSAWQRLLQLTAASPFTGTWMSLATTVGALLAILLLRRLVPRPDRQTGSALIVLLSVGLLLSLCRLAFVATGADLSTSGRAGTVLTTFFRAPGAGYTVVAILFAGGTARTRAR